MIVFLIYYSRIFMNEILNQTSLDNQDNFDVLENQEEQNFEEQETSDVITFEDLGLDEITLKAIEKKGFKVPSPIQVLAIPRLLNGESNVIARARTGTGKTAAAACSVFERKKRLCSGINS